MSQKTKTTLIFLVLFIVLLLAVIFIFNKINKNNEQPIINNNNNNSEELGSKINKENEIKEEEMSNEEKKETLDSINFNMIQLLVMEGYVENELILIDYLIVSEGRALFNYKYREGEVNVEVDFSNGDFGLMLDDYRILNNNSGITDSTEE